MKKIIFFLSFLAVAFFVWATTVPDAWLVRPKGNQTALIDKGRFKSTLWIPSGTGSPSLGGGKDSTGAMWLERGNSKLWIYLKSVGWKEYSTMSETDSMVNRRVDSYYFDTGHYTPVLTNQTNISASTAHLCSYTRVGKHVEVDGQFDMTITAGASPTMLLISLPIAMTFSGDYQGGGTGCSFSAPNLCGGFQTHIGETKIRFRLVSTTTGNEAYSFHFGYDLF